MSIWGRLISSRDLTSVAVSKSDPDLFADACQLDEKLRALMLTSPERRAHGPVYLHRSRKPLAQAVALDRVEIESQGRLDLGEGWGNECEGHCGEWLDRRFFYGSSQSVTRFTLLASAERLLRDTIPIASLVGSRRTESNGSTNCSIRL